jgi:hypothetical protein
MPTGCITTITITITITIEGMVGIRRVPIEPTDSLLCAAGPFQGDSSKYDGKNIHSKINVINVHIYDNVFLSIS